MKPSKEYPVTKTEVARFFKLRGKIVDLALPAPDWTSKNGKVKRWREMPGEVSEVWAAFLVEGIITCQAVVTTPSSAFAIGPEKSVREACKRYIREAFSVPLRGEKKYFSRIANELGLTII